MARIYFHGGPCNGLWLDFGEVSAAPATVTCKGSAYTLDRSAPAYLLGGTGGAAVGGGSAPLAAHAHRGFHDLQRAVNVTMAAEVFRAGELRRAALHRLHRRLRRG